MAQPLKMPHELEAQRVQMADLKAELNAVETQLKEESRAADIRRDGFDKYAPGSSVNLQNLARNGVPKERVEEYKTWQQTRWLELDQQRTAIKGQLREAEETFTAVNNAWRVANAEALRDAATGRAQELAQQITARQSDVNALRQKITQINAIRLKRSELQAAHDLATGAALAAGEALPEAPPMPEMPAESVAAIDHAISTIDAEIETLRDRQQAAAGEARGLQGIMDRRDADNLVNQIKQLAADRGVSLETLRDRLIDLVGEGMISELRGSAESRLSAEVSRLRAELDSITATSDSRRRELERLTSRRHPV